METIKENDTSSETGVDGDSAKCKVACDVLKHVYHLKAKAIKSLRQQSSHVRRSDTQYNLRYSFASLRQIPRAQTPRGSISALALPQADDLYDARLPAQDFNLEKSRHL